MVKRTGGIRRKTRNKLKKNVKDKGKLSLRKYFQSFESGDRVLLKVEPACHKGMYHMRFHSKTGIIKDKKGECYNVEIKDKNKPKVLIVHPVHLKRI